MTPRRNWENTDEIWENYKQLRWKWKSEPDVGETRKEHTTGVWK